MRPLPDFLPGLNSRKWHGRRLHDPIGFQRVHTLARPLDTGEMQWLVRYLGRHRTGNEPWRSQIDAAITAAKFYGRLKQQLRETDADFAERRDESWDRVLDALDFHLRARQIQHLDDVAQGGASGPEVDRKLKEMRTGEDACDCPDSVSSPDQQPRRGA